MKNKNKLLIIPLLIFITLITLSTTYAIDNITVDQNTDHTYNIQSTTQELNLTFDKDRITYNIKDYTDISPKYYFNYKVNNQSRASGTISKNINYEHSFYEDGEHNLLIQTQTTHKNIFNFTFNVKNNQSETPNTIIQKNNTYNIHIQNAKVIGKYTTTLNEGDNIITDYMLTGDNGYLKVVNVIYHYYFPENQSILTHDAIVIKIQTVNGTTIHFYNSKNIQINDQISYNSNYTYQYKTYVNTITVSYEPTYVSKKVKTGYTNKYYKTKWLKKKFVTYRIKKGNLICYNKNLDRVKYLVEHNGKILKTVHYRKKTVMYVKYPVDYYKKVPVYGYTQVFAGYNTIYHPEPQETWVAAEGPISDILKY